MLLGGGISAAASPGTTLAPAAESQNVVPGELIVRFKPESRAAARAAVLSNQKVKVQRGLRLPGTPLAGTSMATPHVAGVEALLLARSPSCSAVQLKATLNSSVDVLGSLSGTTITGGRLNARRALSSLPAACQAPPPPPVALPPPQASPAAAVRCVVPKVKGRTLLQARTLLRSRRCAIGRVRRMYSAKVKKGKIISQARRPGVRLPRGTRVNVLISRGRRR